MMEALSKQNKKMSKEVTFMDLVAASRAHLWLLMSDPSRCLEVHDPLPTPLSDSSRKYQ